MIAFQIDGSHEFPSQNKYYNFVGMKLCRNTIVTYINKYIH